MKELVERALNLAQVKQATYADIRIVRRQTEAVSVKNGVVEGVSKNDNQGFGVRVLVNGAWGFAASARLTAREVDRVTALAFQIAKASARVKAEGVVLDSPRRIVARYETPVKINPFTVPITRKIELLLAADAAMRSVKGVKVADSGIESFRETKTFASTEGSYIEQDLYECGASLVVTAVGNNDVQRRSFPNSFGRLKNTAGFEVVERMDLVSNGQRIAEEAVALLTAPVCPSGVMDIILGGAQLGLQIHESCGHPIELDRVFGTEAAYAGTSFLTPEKLGNFRYGSEVVNISADATIPGALGTFGYDDEGVPAQRIPVVRNGIFVGYMTSRDTAPRLGQQSNGTARADGWSRIPIVRMTNVNLEPGTWKFDDLLADTEGGIYMETNRSWSIDDRRLNFQFGTEIAYAIQGGRLGQMYKNASYTGITPEFWGACDAICNADHWVVWGTPNCGKGQPSQTAHTGHGAAPARFRQIRVGVMK